MRKCFSDIGFLHSHSGSVSAVAPLVQHLPGWTPDPSVDFRTSSTQGWIASHVTFGSWYQPKNPQDASLWIMTWICAQNRFTPLKYSTMRKTFPTPNFLTLLCVHKKLNVVCDSCQINHLNSNEHTTKRPFKRFKLIGFVDSVDSLRVTNTKSN